MSSVMQMNNRHGQRMYVHHTGRKSAECPVVFLHHDIGDSASSEHMRILAESYAEKDFVVFSLDGTHPLDYRNKSEGLFCDFTIDQHITDMEDMVNWARKNLYIPFNFSMAGYGMGAYAALKLAATEFNSRTDNVVACAPFIDGRQFIRNTREADPKEWRHAVEIGHWNVVRNGKAGAYPHERFLKWGAHSLLPDRKSLKMPVDFLISINDNRMKVNDILKFKESLPDQDSKKAVYLSAPADKSPIPATALTMAMNNAARWAAKNASFIPNEPARAEFDINDEYALTV